MSKLAVFVGVPTAVAVVGLAIWNVQLQGEIEELRVQRDTEVSVERTAPATSDSGARSGTRSGSRREDARSQAFDDRLRSLEEQLAAPVAAGDAPRAAPEGDSELSADLPEMLRHADFGRAVNEVIDARDAARRQERLEREAEQRTRRMLRDLEVTDAQRADVLAATQNYMLRREEARRAAGDDDPDREARREVGQALEADWHAALSGILDATQLESALKRTERRQGPNRADPRRQRPNRENPRRRGGEQQ